MTHLRLQRPETSMLTSAGADRPIAYLTLGFSAPQLRSPVEHVVRPLILVGRGLFPPAAPERLQCGGPRMARPTVRNAIS